MAPDTRVSGVILAAGSSSRLGRPKQLLDLFGEPLLRHVVRHAVASRLSEVVLVLGHRAPDIASAVGDLGQRLAVNPDYAVGQSTSLRLGLSTIAPDSSAVLFLLGDQPQVTSSIIDALITHHLETRASIVMPTYGGIPANPVLFAANLFHELAQVSGDQGARSIIKRHRPSVAYISVSDETPPQDIDTEEDYQAILTAMTSNASQRPPYSPVRQPSVGKGV